METPHVVTYGGGVGPSLRAASCSLHRMRGEGRGEGLRATALVAAPLIRPAATLLPVAPRKGEGSLDKVDAG